MAAVIKPNRSEINRAFPVAGFTIRTGVSPSWVEVAVATSPELLYGGSEFKSQRTASNFWSSRGLGALPAERGEAVFLVPPQVMARFSGQDRLYYALATYRQSDFRTPQVDQIPLQTVPYITISRSFTGGGRGLMNVPNRAGGLTRNSNQYVDVSQQSLEWGGDTASPGEMVPVGQPANGTPRAVNGKSNGDTTAPTAAQPTANNNPPATQQDYDFAYDDGFGGDFWKKPKAHASAENYGMELVAQSVGQRRGAMAAPLAEVEPIYNPTDTQQALAMQAEFNQRKQAWRVGVPDTSFYPHSAICHLEMPFTDGESYHGTGFYIGPNRILTCAHNVVEKADDNSEKYTAKSITITPGKNDDQQAAPAFTVQPSSWTYHPRYDGSFDFDLAVIEVNNSAPNGQYFPVLEELLESRQSPIIVCGYSSLTPTDPGTIQHLDGDAIRELGASGETFMYNLQTMGGASGSPVYQVLTYEDEEQQMSVMEIHIVGVHVSGFNLAENRGCRLTESKIAWINNPTAASFGLQANSVRNNGHHSATNGNGYKTSVAQRNKVVAHAYEETEDTHLPEYSGAKRFVPAKYFKTMPAGRDIKQIVIHITDCPTTADKDWDVRYFKNPDDEVSAHYVVQQDGEVVQMVKHDNVAFHAHDANDDSIGIEHVANIKDLFPTEAEYCASAALVNWLCTQYNIPMDRAHIVGHHEVDKKTSHTYCPDGAGWNWDYYMELVTTGSCSDEPNASYDPTAQSLSNAIMPKSQNHNGHHHAKKQARAFGGPAVVVGKIGEAVIERLVGSTDGDISWELDQMKNAMKYPLNKPELGGDPPYETQRMTTGYLSIMNLLQDEIWANFEVSWQYNQQSLGNINIINTQTNDAVGWGLKVTGYLVDDANAYYAEGSDVPMAAIDLNLTFLFFREVGPDKIGVMRFKLYANGTYSLHSEWTQE